MAPSLQKSLAVTFVVGPILLAFLCAHWQRQGSAQFESVVFDDPDWPGLELIQKEAVILKTKLAKQPVAQVSTEESKPSTTPSVSTDTGVSANGVGNLPVFLTALGTNSAALTAGCIIFGIWNKWYKILYRDAITTGRTKNFDGPILSHWNSDNDDPMQTSWFGWIRASWALQVHDVWESAGLDHAMMIEFLNMCFYILRAIALPMFFIAGPINCWCGGNAAGQDHESWFSLGNVKYYNWIYYTTGFWTWYVAFIVNYYIMRYMKEFVAFRMKWLKLWDARRAHTLLVYGIPDDYQNEVAFKKFWDDLFPGGRIDWVHLTKDTSVVLKKWNAKTAAEDKLKYLKEDAPEEKRAACTAEVSRTTEEHQQAVNELQAENEQGQGFCSTGFVHFRRREDAEIALHIDMDTDMFTWNVEYAPQPSDIIWGDMTQSPVGDTWRMFVGYALTIGLMIGYMPIVVAISNVATSINMGPLQPLWAGEAPAIGLTIMVDFLPTFLDIIFTNFFSLYDGAVEQYKISVWYWWMNVLFVVMVTAIGPGFLHFVETMAHNPLNFFHLLATTMPPCTHYYMKYLTMQWLSQGMYVSRYIQVIKFRMIWPKVWPDGTEREIGELSEPEAQDYYGIGSRTARWSTLFCIGIVYGTLSPPCGVLAWFTMIILRIIYGYLFTFAEKQKTDMGGLFFVRGCQNLHFTLHLYFVVMIGVLYERGADWVPFATAIVGWVYVFWRQKVFYRIKWERVTWPQLCEIDKEDEDFAALARKPVKMTTDGLYTQPELMKTKEK